MVRRAILYVAAGIAANLESPALAHEALVLEPSSKWELDYATDSCALRRNFGAGEQLTQLEMRRFQPGIGLQISVVSQLDMTKRSTIRFRFGDEAKWETEQGTLYAYFADSFEGVIFRRPLFKLPLADDVDNEEWTRFMIENDIEAMEAEASEKVTSLTLSRAFKQDVTLNTGSLKEPIKALNTCMDELITHWGIDVAAHKTLTRYATALDLQKAARMIDYPPKMLKQSLPGLVNIRLDIDETGRVTQCHIQMPLSDPEFEEGSCADIQHGFEFDPALDKDGRPIKSYYVNSVRFLIN